jgi:hypothetical protein
MARYIARIQVFERHPDGSSRTFTVTRTVDESATVSEIFDWRDKRIHDPVNGEYASPEITLTPDDSEM